MTKPFRLGYATSDWGRDPSGEPIPGGANWVRIQTPTRQLMAAGHEVQIGSSIAVNHRTKQFIILDHDEQPMGEPPEIVVLQRWMHRDSAGHIRAAREAGQVIINDVDDWFDGLDPANQAFDHTHPKTNPDSNRDHYRRALAASSLITASTEYLAGRIRRLGAPVTVVRNAIRTQDYDIEMPTSETTGLVVAWVGGISWRSGDLETIAPWFGRWLRENGCTFLHHGAHPGQTSSAWEMLGLDDDLVEGWRPMVPPHLYGRQLMAGFDIGIVPLADVPFNQAKSWIKGLEYATAGIPFVASLTDEYAALGAGITAKRPRDWMRAMDRMLDPQVRLDQHMNGLLASQRQDIGHRWVDWEKAYSDALGRR